MRVQRRLTQGLTVGALAVLVLAGCTASESVDELGELVQGAESGAAEETARSDSANLAAGSFLATIDPSVEIGPGSAVFGQVVDCGSSGHFEAERLEQTSVRIMAHSVSNCDANTEVQFVLSEVDGQIIVSQASWRNWTAYDKELGEETAPRPLTSLTLSSFDLDGVISGTIDNHVLFWTNLGQ